MESQTQVEMLQNAQRSGELTWDFYRQMYTIRRLEETLLSLFSKGLLFGTVHTCIGQEACAVGVINALDRDRDIVWSNHRGHGHFLAYCDDAEGLIAEIMGRASGVCGGIGGTQHLHKDNFYTNGVLGGTLPCAVGTALAEKLQRSGTIVTAFLGDGAFGEGVVYESLNVAALWQLPILVVLEDNRYAQSTPSYLEHAGDLASRAASFGITSTEVVVTDVFDVYEAAVEAVKVREGVEPHFLVLRTCRFAPHSKGDDTRPKEEIEGYRNRDPLLSLREKLKKMDTEKLSHLEMEIDNRIDQSVRAATAAPFMSTDDFLEGVNNQW
jgi:TPP-dependent pyruvate/acetoin dehydrogenase alpha subunit